MTATVVPNRGLPGRVDTSAAANPAETMLTDFFLLMAERSHVRGVVWRPAKWVYDP